ncbi:MAG: hypothetical protein F6K42_12415 [Leptolyngbya sp. SIO1D8]|nr:hypothetical protein [Leptolyngbya sp. SIO1D8]
MSIPMRKAIKLTGSEKKESLQPHQIAMWSLITIAIIGSPFYFYNAWQEAQAAEQARQEEEAATKSLTDPEEALAHFKKDIDRLDPNGRIVTDVRLANSTATVVVQVTSEWHSQPKQVRLDATEAMRQAWSLQRDPFGQTGAYLRLVSSSGEEVGGYLPLKGLFVVE